MTTATAQTQTAEHGGATRQRLLRAALRLMARHGIDGVSLNEIVRQSGIRNASALQYHFKDKRGLLQAIFDTFTPMIETRRIQLANDMLERYRDGTIPVSAIARIVVVPIIELLDIEDGGRDYLRLLGHVHNHELDPDFRFDQRENAGLQAIAQMTSSAAADMPEHLFESRRMMIKTLLLHSLSDYCRKCDDDPGFDERHRADFLATLNAALIAVFTAPYAA